MNESQIFTNEDKNNLRAFMATEAGKKLLLRISNQEITYQTEAYSDRTSSERQAQLINRMAGLYWVRSKVASLIEVPKDTKEKK